MYILYIYFIILGNVYCRGPQVLILGLFFFPDNFIITFFHPSHKSRERREETAAVLRRGNKKKNEQKL